MKTGFTPREEEILKLIIHEKTSVEIADMLHLSIRTVDTHRKNILRKSKCKSLIGLMKFAIKAGLVENFHFKKKLFKHT